MNQAERPRLYRWSREEYARLIDHAFLDEDDPVELLWSFVGGSPRVNGFRLLQELPAQTEESAAMSKELKRRGFRFVGPTVCYSLMQACGLVNDHVTGCFRYAEV